MVKKLYYGDNLDILRENIPDESIDLIYLDPPFNSQSSYNIIFKNSEGKDSQDQITAFEDTWKWNIESERCLNDVKDIKGDLGVFLKLLVKTLGENSLSAYLAMMSIRLIELHRVLKSTGSIYLHCDTTASHYLKVILDMIFGTKNYRNQITWKRTSSHSDAKRFPRITDIIFYYVKSNDYFYNPIRAEYSDEYIDQYYCNVDLDGRRYTFSDLTKPKGSKGYFYTLLGCEPPSNGWRMPQSKADEWIVENRIAIPPTGKTPRYKRYLDEVKGKLIGDIWDDLPPINSQAKESLGYPTQKPLSLLERIIQASSKEGDLILDPFCGCGTTVHAAEKLNRQWIGIDITHLAISLVENRLITAFSANYLSDDEGLKNKLVDFFEVEGTPKTLEAAQDLFSRDPYQFQWWAISLVNAQPYQGKKKGADTGIDGIVYFDDLDRSGKSRKPVTKKIIVSVKGGKNVNAAMIRDLVGTVGNNDASLGFFITMTPPTKPMITESAKAGFYKAGNGQEFPKIQILTIQGLLDRSERPQYLDWSHGASTFKKAQKEVRKKGVQLTIDV